MREKRNHLAPVVVARASPSQAAPVSQPSNATERHAWYPAVNARIALPSPFRAHPMPFPHQPSRCEGLRDDEGLLPTTYEVASGIEAKTCLTRINFAAFLANRELLTKRPVKNGSAR